MQYDHHHVSGHLPTNDFYERVNAIGLQANIYNNGLMFNRIYNMQRPSNYVGIKHIDGYPDDFSARPLRQEWNPIKAGVPILKSYPFPKILQ